MRAELNFNRVREIGTDIRVHGNGFLQVDLPNNFRLHVWGHPSLPRQRQPTPIHDHVFGFKSTVLRGRLVNVVYIAIPFAKPDPDNPLSHAVYNPISRAGADTQLVDSGRRCVVQQSSVQLVTAGNGYEMVAGWLHETYVNQPTVTLLDKRPPQREYLDPARIMVPLGREPDNTFTRYDTPVDDLWSIVEEVMHG